MRSAMPMVTNMLYGGPFRDMRLLQEEVNRLAQSAAPPQATFPAINVYAHQDGIVITAELPGVQQDDLEITVHRDTVTLRGERQDKSDDAGAYHRRERGSGTFVRTFGLPFQVDPDKVDAKLKESQGLTMNGPGFTEAAQLRSGALGLLKKDFMTPGPRRLRRRDGVLPRYAGASVYADSARAGVRQQASEADDALDSYRRDRRLHRGDSDLRASES